MAQVNLEADTTEEFGNRIDQYPPVLHPRVYTKLTKQKNNIVSVDAPIAK